MTAGLTGIAEGVWVDAAPVRILGTRLTSTMTVLRLPSGGLVLHSPIADTPERRASVEALGPVEHLYAPNRFHHLRLGDWAAAFPKARVHAPDGLSKKRPELGIDRTHGAVPEPAFEGVIDELVVDGFRLGETAVFHHPSRTLVVTDLVQNVGRPDGAWTKFYTKTMGFYDRVALSAALRHTSVSDRAAFRRSLDALLALPFERIVVGHGEPIVSGAKESFAAAFSWVSRD